MWYGKRVILCGEKMRPFYVIGHNTNTIANVHDVLDAGANAVEPNIQWDDDNHDLIVAHDAGGLGPTGARFPARTR